MHPEQFARCRVQGHYRSSRSARRIQHAVNHQRRGFKFEFGSRAEGIGLETPGHHELVKIVGADLIEGSVARAGKVSAVGLPFAILCAGLRARGHRREEQRK